MLISLQGEVYVANRTATGAPGAFRSLGDVPEISISMSVSTKPHYESRTGQRQQDGRLQLGKEATVKLVMDDWDADNLALALYGTPATNAAGTVTGETMPDSLVAGDIVRLNQVGVSSVNIVAIAGTPATLVEGTHYEVLSAKHGTIRILDTSGLTQPFVADYAYSGGINIAMFNAAPPELWVRIEGVNTAAANAPVLTELYRVLLDPVSELALKHAEDYGSLSMSGSVLYDATKAGDATLGQFGRYVEIA